MSTINVRAFFQFVRVKMTNITVNSHGEVTLVDLVLETGSQYLQTFITSLRKYQYGLINHCSFPIHTSKLENINHKIKVLKCPAFGFHDVEYFTWKIIQCTTN